MKSLLLDTCALIWLATSSSKLSRTARKAIEEAPFLYTCAASEWELSQLIKQRKIEMPLRARELMTILTERYGISVLNVTGEVAFRASELPDIHRDPIDRFIIATAMLNNLDVVTGDERFPEYGLKTLK